MTTKWCEVLARIIPRLRHDDDKARAAGLTCREEAAAVSAAQRAIEPLITAQTEYLVRKGEINGFTRQLQTGFQRQHRGE